MAWDSSQGGMEYMVEGHFWEGKEPSFANQLGAMDNKESNYFYAEASSLALHS